MSNHYIQIPPDSSGKKVRNTLIWDITLNINDNGLINLGIGDILSGGSSGATGVFKGYATEVGVTTVYLDNLTGEFNIGENLLSPQLSILGSIEKFEKLFSSNNLVTDPDNPSNILKVDDEGASFTRFKEGDIKFDAFGKAQHSQTSYIYQYSFIYNDMVDEFIDTPNVGGVISHDPDKSHIVLSTTSDNGSSIRREGIKNIPYLAGVGNMVIMSLSMGDNGKEGVVRKWGLENDESGIYFKHDGQTLKTVLKHSVTGQTIEEEYEQNFWNGDRLLNPNIHSFEIDLSKYNIFWIDYQWLGAGRIRFGVFTPNGDRITCHTIRNVNKKNSPYIRSANLPVAFEQYNTMAVASTSELKVGCVDITRQNQQLKLGGKEYYHTTETFVDVDQTETLLFSAKFKEVINNLPNYVGIIPTSIEVITVGDPIFINIYSNCELSDTNYANNVSEAIDTSEVGNIISTGQEINKLIYTGGKDKVDITPSLDMSFFKPKTIDNYTFDFTVETIEKTTEASAKVLFKINWKEIK